MGKNLIQQRRGKANPRYVSLKFKSVAEARHVPVGLSEEGVVVDLVTCPNHFAPLAKVEYESGINTMIAPEGMNVGQKIINHNVESQTVGACLALADISEGSEVFNIESVPGDGGKFVRAPGTTARLQSKDEKYANVIMPSKRIKKFKLACRAALGVVSGGGRTEKPLIKAGTAFYKYRAKHKLWPIVSGSAMNAVDHPLGNKRTQRKSKAKPVPKNAPAGRKVGYLRPRRTGKKK